MSQFLGKVALNDTINATWNTTDGSGGSITRATDGSIRIYKEASATQRTSANGITDTEDFDTITGTHHLSIDTSDDTDVGFYANNTRYNVMLEGATIDGQTVNHFIGWFEIDNRIACLVDNTVDTLLKRYGFASDTAAIITTTAGQWNGAKITFPATASIGQQTSYVMDCEKVSTVERLIVAPLTAAPANNDPFYLHVEG